MSAPDKHMEKARELYESRIGSMCLTWDHSFGLMKTYQKEGLRSQFRQVGHHDLIPAIAQALREAEAEGMRRSAEIARKHEKRAAELRLSGGETHDEQVAFRVAYAILAEIEAGGE